MKNYTYWQIKKLLAEQDIFLERLTLYKYHVPHYRMVDTHGNTIAEPVTLDGIRKIFKDLDYSTK
jgi:hypothetical protein